MIRHQQATRTRALDTDPEDVSAAGLREIVGAGKPTNPGISASVRVRLWLQSIREAVLLAVLVMYGFLFWAAVEVLIGG